MNRLLVVGAHAMDAEIIGGGLAVTLRRVGWECRLYHLTRGERGSKDRTPDVFAAQLMVEMANAADVLGTQWHWAGFPAPLEASSGVVEAILSVISDFQPTLVITHWIGSWHESHRRTHRATVEAIARSRQMDIKLAFGENLEDLTGFVPNGFIDVTDTTEAWLRALRCYELFRRTEPGGVGGTIPYHDYYTTMLKVRGMQAGHQRSLAIMTTQPEAVLIPLVRYVSIPAYPRLP